MRPKSLRSSLFASVRWNVSPQWRTHRHRMCRQSTWTFWKLPLILMPSRLHVLTLAYSGDRAVLMTFRTSRLLARLGADSRSYVALSMLAYSRGLTRFSSEEYLLNGQIYDGGRWRANGATT